MSGATTAGGVAAVPAPSRAGGSCSSATSSNQIEVAVGVRR